MRRIIILLAATLLCTACANSSADRLDRPRALSNWFSVESMAALEQAAAPELAATIAENGGPAGMARSFAQQLGAEETVIDELALTLNGKTVYQRLSRFTGGSFGQTTLIIDGNGAVTQAALRPAPSPTAATAQDAQTELHLPFGAPGEGRWFTFWGGDNVIRNYHVVQPDQRHAYDFLVVRDGATHGGASQDLASYYCWDEPILAPAPGRVVGLTETLPDNPIGQMDRDSPAGNHVVIEHRPGEYSVLAHLRQNSVRVNAGDTVNTGDIIGTCGNSGNSSEPHLHYHLQNESTLGGAASGLPAPFHRYEADGQQVDTGRPIRGEFVTP